MTSTHTVKNGVRYRYYVCRLLTEGRRIEAGSVVAAPAPVLEEVIAGALRTHSMRSKRAPGSGQVKDTELFATLLHRVEIFPDHLAISIKEDAGGAVIDVPWKKPRSRPKREIVLPHANNSKDGRPIKTEIRTGVVKAVALGRLWLNEMMGSPELTTDALAQREKRSKRSIQMILSLNFVSPEVIRALITGKLPRGIGITRLVDLPSDWDRQKEVLGLARTAKSEAVAAGA